MQDWRHVNLKVLHMLAWELELEKGAQLRVLQFLPQELFFRMEKLYLLDKYMLEHLLNIFETLLNKKNILLESIIMKCNS